MEFSQFIRTHECSEEEIGRTTEGCNNKKKRWAEVPVAHIKRNTETKANIQADIWRKSTQGLYLKLNDLLMCLFENYILEWFRDCVFIQNVSLLCSLHALFALPHSPFVETWANINEIHAKRIERRKCSECDFMSPDQSAVMSHQKVVHPTIKNMTVEPIWLNNPKKSTWSLSLYLKILRFIQFFYVFIIFKFYSAKKTT